MELSHIKYFITVAEIQNLSRAAEVVNVTQPALSKAIKTVESELNTTLFDRKGKRIILNANGNYFLESIKPILSALELACFEVKNVNDDLRGIINLKLSCASPLIIELIASFRSKYPLVEFNLTQHDISEKTEGYNVVISDKELVDNGFSSLLLFKEDVKLAIPIYHRLYDKEEIYVADLLNNQFILPSAYYPLRCTIDKFLNECGVNLNVALTSDDAATVRSFSTKTNSLTFIPEYTWFMNQQKNLRLTSIVDLKMFREVYFSCNNPDGNVHLECFSDYICNNVQRVKS